MRSLDFLFMSSRSQRAEADTVPGEKLLQHTHTHTCSKGRLYCRLNDSRALGLFIRDPSKV